MSEGEEVVGLGIFSLVAFQPLMPIHQVRSKRLHACGQTVLL